MSVFDYQQDSDGIVTITMDMNGPVNAVNEEFGQAMSETVDRLESETNLAGVVFTSAKPTFFAGGDLNLIAAVEPGSEAELFESVERSKAFFRRLEKLPVPVVAAINGAALGGGFELCLACNHRIAWNSNSVEIGLPEVQLGLLPGAGGIVRLTNLLGLQDALPYLLEGKKFVVKRRLMSGSSTRQLHHGKSSCPEPKPGFSNIKTTNWLLFSPGIEKDTRSLAAILSAPLSRRWRWPRRRC